MREANSLVTRVLSNVVDQKASMEEITQMVSNYLLPLEYESSLFVDPLNSVSYHTAAFELVKHITKLNIKHPLSKSLAQYLNSVASREYMSVSDIFTDSADSRIVRVHQLIARIVDRYCDVEGFILKNLTEFLHQVKNLIPKLITTDSVLFVAPPPTPWSSKIKTRSLHNYSMVSLTSWQRSPIAEVLSSVTASLASFSPEKLSKQARDSILPWLNTIRDYIDQCLGDCYSTITVLLYIEPIVLKNILALMNKCQGAVLPCIFRMQYFSNNSAPTSNTCKLIKPLISSLCANAGSLQIRMNGNSLSNYATKLSTLNNTITQPKKSFFNSIIFGYKEIYNQLLQDSRIHNHCSVSEAGSETSSASTSIGFIIALAIAEFNSLDHKNITTDLDTYISRYPPSSTELMGGKRPASASASALKKIGSINISTQNVIDLISKEQIARSQSLYNLSKPFVMYIYNAIEFCNAHVKGNSLWSKILSVSPDFFNLTMEEHKASIHIVLQDFAAHLHSELIDVLTCVPIGEKLCILQACLTNSCDGIAEITAESIATYVTNITKKRESVKAIANSSDSIFALITALLAYLHKALTLLLSYASTRMLSTVSRVIKMLEHEYITLAHKTHRGHTESTHLSRLTILTHAKNL